MTGWLDPRLGELIAGAYFVLIALAWVALALGVPAWGRRWTLPPPDGSDRIDEDGLVPVGVCVPARDEAHDIGPCVRAVLASDLAAVGMLELAVVDDRSTDGTAEAAHDAADGDERLRVVRGSDPPSGWAGKPWACARAAAEVGGEVLVFLDADVVVDPRALGALVGELRRRRLGMLSAFGSWRLVGFWERVVIPAVGWLVRSAADLDRVNDPGRPEAFANGQLIVVERTAYERVGGHGAVRDQVLDDVKLAEAFKREGVPIGLVVAPWAYSVRLYRSLGEIVAGYGKNLYEGMGRNPVLGLGAVLFVLVGALLPALLLPLGLFLRIVPGWAVPSTSVLVGCAVVSALQVWFRWRIERRDRRRPAVAWLHPLANVVLVGILLRSVFGVRATWKGRRFVDGRAAP